MNNRYINLLRKMQNNREQDRNPTTDSSYLQSTQNDLLVKL